MKIWKDIIEPTSTEYLWYRLNEFGGFVGWFKYSDGKWRLVKEEDVNPSGSGGKPEISHVLNITTPFVAGSNINIETTYGITTEQFNNLIAGKYNAVKFPFVDIDNPGITYAFAGGDDVFGNSSVYLISGLRLIRIYQNGNISTYDVSIQTITATW